VTRQFLSGELSLRLGRLEELTDSPELGRQVARLRVEAERVPISHLSCLMARGLILSQQICKAALEGSDWPTFLSRVEACSELREFGVCAGLIDPGATPEAARPSWWPP
jgi:hypothetical protein